MSDEHKNLTRDVSKKLHHLAVMGQQSREDQRLSQNFNKGKNINLKKKKRENIAS